MWLNWLKRIMIGFIILAKGKKCARVSVKVVFNLKQKILGDN